MTTKIDCKASWIALLKKRSLQQYQATFEKQIWKNRDEVREGTHLYCLKWWVQHLHISHSLTQAYSSQLQDSQILCMDPKSAVEKELKKNISTISKFYHIMFYQIISWVTILHVMIRYYKKLYSMIWYDMIWYHIIKYDFI